MFRVDEPVHKFLMKLIFCFFARWRLSLEFIV